MKKKIIVGFLYLIVSYLLFIFVCKKSAELSFSYDLLFLYTIFNIFVFLHFVIDIKKLYDFIYRKRYLFGLIVLLILVIGKYNGSSIEIWRDYIQPEYHTNNNIIAGVSRPIRSDEWLVSTPTNLSQVNDDFSSNNDILRGTNNLVTFYPNLPSKDISLLAAPNNIGYLFLDKERAFSLAWYLPYFILFFSTFELFMILTKKKKIYALLGSIMITFSPVIQWWQSPHIIAYGSLAITIFYYFLNSDNNKKKLLLSILFGYSGYLYIMCLYPAWQVPYGYVFLILLIWIIVNNKDKLHKKDLLYLIPVLLIITIPTYIIFEQNRDVIKLMTSTVYPGARMSTGGGEWKTLFTYMIDMFYPYKRGFGNPCEFSQYLSLFPIPIIYSIYLMIKNKKLDLFLILSNIVLIFLTIWVMFPLPEIISRLSLIYMSTETRAQVAIGYLSIIQIVYILANYEIIAKKRRKYKLLNIKNAIIALLSVIITFVTIKISNNVIEFYFPGYVNLYTSVICLVIFSIVIFLFICNFQKTNMILVIMLSLISIMSGFLVSPINKGLSVLYDKPLAKEIRKIVSEDDDAIFIAANSGMVLSNYLIVNGAKTINSTNYIPNLDLYYQLDKDKKYSDVYNRYHHIAVEITNEETSFSLIQPDLINLKLNNSDVCKIDVDYIVTINPNEYYDKYEKVYDEYNVNVYKTNCEVE